MGTKSEVGYGKPPKDRQFGQPNGNPRRKGMWDVTSTPRFKLEKMIELSDQELSEVVNDDKSPRFERDIAKILLSDIPIENKWKIVEGMINQVYGYPKQSVERVDLTPPPPLSPRKKPIDKLKR